MIPIDPKYLGDLEAMDIEAYGIPYDWTHPFERITVMMCEGALGFISYRIINHVEIEKLVVKEAFRRNGVGSKMMTWLINRCRHHGISDLRITIPESNIIGSYFLASHGFDSILKGRVIEFNRKVVI